ncbi:TetR/AcrR family transcriptional regulator [Isoptericola chiayiensis]|mgnify:CR=1 FL=1|uniref:TetR/AcrR family transcriptional regulator n=1 Tax=Isoptericola chiayiensis TaxID=579446 RepID=A0ABP8YCY9_9MICO|nr:TetR/AcrR family transcriptional regulator [Isoptericola chiayiensis]NOV99771.1 AcrR family transcriptional regulator [Isoptericola chiayiensis]
MRTTNVADSVLKAALDLFATQGYATTSVQQIVEAAGVTKGAMYHYFQSKDDLLFAIYDRMLTLQRRHLDDIVAAGGPPLEVIRAACVDVVETSIDLLPEGTVFFRSMHMLSPARHQEVTRRRRDYHDAFAALVEKGQAEGVVRTDVPRSVLIAHFYSDVHYLSYWYSPSGPETKTEVAQQLADLFLRSITVEDG